MRRDAGWTDSLWEPIHDIPSDGVLQEDLEADACVVGAGMTGLCTAYALVRDGRRVVVLDDGPVGGGESARRSGHCRTVPLHLPEFVRAHGAEKTGQAIQSQVEALDWLEAMVRREGISCRWKRVPGYSRGAVEDEARVARELGIAAEPAAPARTAHAVVHANQACLDPAAFLAGLAAVLRRQGVRIHTSTHAASVRDDGVVTSTGRTVRCRDVIEATNAPVFGSDPPQQAYRQYLIAADIGRDVEDALYWDGEHHVRVAGDQLVIAGAHHPTGKDPDHSETFGALEVWGREKMGTGHTHHRWSTQVWQPRDALGSIGQAGRTFIATGDAGNGCTHAAVAAMLLADLVAGRDNPYSGIYDPQRTKPPAVPPWQSEKRHLSAGRRRVLMPGDVRNAAEIVRGQGAIMRRGIRLFAVSRDEEGEVHEQLGICTHDGCVVAWNAAEKTWDCPCDGSRYNQYGTVINAPANEDLGSYSPQPTDGVSPQPPQERGLEEPAFGR